MAAAISVVAAGGGVAAAGLCGCGRGLVRVKLTSPIMAMNGGGRGGVSSHLRPYLAWQPGQESNSGPEPLESAGDADSVPEDRIFFDILPISEHFRESSGSCRVNGGRASKEGGEGAGRRG